jgi:thiamine-phosphate pyrophosphorylase
LRRTAALLKRPAGVGKHLPRLLFFTDPERTPDPEAVVASLPPGSGVVFRAFGAPDAEANARRLLGECRAARCKLLIGADHRLAARIGADGVHLPERLAWRARAVRRPRWIVTAAAHSERAAHLALRAGADATVLSAVFPSRSPSAGVPIGPVRLAHLARSIGPVYALGGVNNKTARRLVDAGLAGLAAVDGLQA